MALKEPTRDELNAYLKLGLTLAKKAGDNMHKYYTNKITNKNKIDTLKTKSTSVDMVTKIDQANEKLIIDGIMEIYPKHKIIGEESSDGKEELTDAPTWIIDPIDGTTNFIHGFPFTCVSIGLAINKILYVGIVHCEALKETFTAIKGNGAFRNECKINVSSEKELKNCLLATEFGYDRTKEGIDMMCNGISNILSKNVRSIRCTGSCALNMCSVAMGRNDIYFEGKNENFGPKVWDVAASAVIVREAGGIVGDWNGGKFDMFSGRIMAANNKELADSLISTIKGE